jgi:Protein of unknown function (DUF3551)
MTRCGRRIAVSATALGFATLFLPALAATPAAAAGAPPFCVLRGGPEGASPPQICAFFDYQACLQAAADLHGNCVQNIDYHGEVSTAPAPARARHRR